MNLALENEGVKREALRVRLWPDQAPGQSAKRLRQLLWRIRRHTRDALIVASHDRLALAEAVAVDYRAAEAIASNVLPGRTSELPVMDPMIPRLLGTELLRGVTDEEILDAQARWDRLRQLALERLALAHIEIGETGIAAELATAAADVDELAERPHRILVEAYLHEGDTIGARRAYLHFEELARRHLEADPSPAFRKLITDIARPTDAR